MKQIATGPYDAKQHAVARLCAVNPTLDACVRQTTYVIKNIFLVVIPSTPLTTYYHFRSESRPLHHRALVRQGSSLRPAWKNGLSVRAILVSRRLCAGWNASRMQINAVLWYVIESSWYQSADWPFLQYRHDHWLITAPRKWNKVSQKSMC